MVLRLILAVAAYLSLSAATLHAPRTSSTCSKHDLSVLSCSAESLTTDTCCVESPGGLLLLTQLYSATAGGPEDTWTLHGMWNDYCNGSYPASCDNSRNYTGFAEILEDYDQLSLLDYMRVYWRLCFQNDPVITTTNGTDEQLWEHEWAKHGTCMTTIRPSCYANYTQYLELVQFLNEAVHLYKQLPSQDYLGACGIVPSNSTTYALADIETCFVQATGGYLPHIGCNGDTLNELWYYYYLAGRVPHGNYVPTNTTYSSTCPETGIVYAPKPAS
ncbi:putative ribonuclease T2 [Phyllosticta capitalensis]|uniref:putative ribonuclease T2 n=1 Tax=Phyllosticta capitalensis TaxID=121624 RepID=UPI0031300CD5